MTATQASRHFSEMLDKIEHGGEEVEIVRNGKPVVRVAAVGTASKTFGDWIDFMRANPVDPNWHDEVMRGRAIDRAVPERNQAALPDQAAESSARP